LSSLKMEAAASCETSVINYHLHDITY
jgi:hypothetical protein